MGIIKKLKLRDLVGGHQNPEVDVYPVSHVKAIYNDLNESLEDILANLQQLIISGGGSSSASSSPINYLWAYTTASSDTAALAKLNRNEEVTVPTNFVSNTSITVPEGYYIYMTTARTLGGVYLRWEDDSIWSVPLRIGTGRSTSYTGNDGEGYNYIYCRTATSTPPNIPASLTVAGMEALEGDYGISASDGSTSLALYNVWYDHPLGVTDTYLWEWIAISRGSDGTLWSAYMGPTLWSRFGVDGKDGDGIEYIFTVATDLSPAPLFINTYYDGRIGELGSEFLDVLIETCTSNSFYQQDDFIPSGWHDTPLVLSLEYNKQYVSIRKKLFTNENVGYWGPFSQPVLWAKINLSLGPRGAIIRNRGTWKYENVVYCCNTDMNGDGPTDNNIVYIDVVYYNGNYYQCKLHHSSNSDRLPTNTLYWQIAEDFEFIATKLIIADTADALILSGGSVVVKDDQLNIVGGMTGGTLAATNDVIIWAGGATSSASSTKFKVYEDGNVDISGTVRASLLYPKTVDLGSEEVNTVNVIDILNNPAGFYIAGNNSGFLYPVTLPSALTYLGLELHILFPIAKERTRSYYGEEVVTCNNSEYILKPIDDPREGYTSFNSYDLVNSISFFDGTYIVLKAMLMTQYNSSTQEDEIIYYWLPLYYCDIGSIRFTIA